MEDLFFILLIVYIFMSLTGLFLFFYELKKSTKIRE